MKRNMFWCKILKLLRSIFLYMENTLWRGVTIHILVKEKAQRKIEIWLYMVWSWPNLVSRLNWVKRDEKSHFSVKGGKTSWSCWRFVRFVPKLPKNQLKCRSIYHPSSYFIAAVALFVSRLFFFYQPRQKWKLVAKSRCDARLESPHSLVEFRPVIHV